MLVNMCCGVPPAECGTKHSVFDRVMRLTNVSLNAGMSTPVEERHLRWTTRSNLLNWFENFKAFLVELDFAGIDDEGGELTFTEEQLRRIMNIDETELALNGDTHAGDRPAVSFMIPTFRSRADPWQNHLLPARGYLGATLPASACLRTFSFRRVRWPRRGRRSGTSF